MKTRAHAHFELIKRENDEMSELARVYRRIMRENGAGPPIVGR